jgi:ADP-ribose pyrophosphatase YjhB (NUDIX family)
MLTCTFEDGGQTNKLRHAVTGMIVIKDGQILLEKRAAHLTCGGKIAIPGGYMDQGERIFECAMREVMEETGYETHNPVLFLINDKPDRKQEDRQNIEFTMILECGDKTGSTDNETEDIFWSPLDKLPPKEKWAFDHYEEVDRYREYLKNPCPLPILNFGY